MELFNRDLFDRLFARKHSYRDQLLIQEGLEDQEKIKAIKEIAGEQWNELMDREDAGSVDLRKIYYKVFYQVHQSKKTDLLQRSLQYFSRAAAILFIPLLLAAVYVFIDSRNTLDSQMVEMSFAAPDGMRSHFVLPDGSSGWLNGGSHLQYSSNKSKIRNVKLEGEAYFDVVKNAKWPFVVNAGIFDVKVLGTRFNVYSYPEEEWAEVVLESGKVTVTDQWKEMKVDIVPGQCFAISNKTKKYQLAEVDVSEYLEWIDGKLFFRNEPMQVVVRKLERFYNTDVEIADQEILSYRFRAMMQNESLEEVIRFMELTLPISANIVPREKLNNGTFTKQKIILKMK